METMAPSDRGDIRRRLGIILLIWGLAVWCANAVADDQGSIYTWTDENGIKHFSNVKPDADGESIVKTTEEIPHDSEADQIRESIDRQRQRDRELKDMEYRLRNAEKAREDAEREAEEASVRAERLGLQLDDALEESDRNNSRVVYPYYWNRPPRHITVQVTGLHGPALPTIDPIDPIGLIDPNGPIGPTAPAPDRCQDQEPGNAEEALFSCSGRPSTNHDSIQDLP